MATWHVTVDSSVGSGSKFTAALHALLLRPVRTQFESMGFTVQPMPEHCQPALSVSHSNESAITLWLLQHSGENLHIRQIS